MLKIKKKIYNLWRIYIIISVTLLILSVPLISFLKEKEKINPKQLKIHKILTTTTILKDSVKHLLGIIDPNEIPKEYDLKYKKIDNFQCESLMKTGVDPHNYKTTLSDRKKIKEADLIIINGLNLETKMTDSFFLLKEKDKLWIAGDFLDKQKLIKSEDDSEHYDPHVWFEIDLWRNINQNLKTRLKQTLNSKEDILKLENNYEIFDIQLKELKKKIISEMKELKNKLTKKNNEFILVTAHDAFSYWQKFSEENSCSFRLESIQGISTQTESSIHRILQLSKILAENNVKSIFTENSIPKDSLKSLKEEVNKLKKHSNPIKIPENVELYSDSLGTDEKIEILNDFNYKHSTYIGAFLNNIKVIKENLL
ncbi:metal ABC transporter solute-binding protein, Zn/Mn family [Candidatus Phytoplasma palmae]|uniref:metal ABC transporter solute-binding protein, Zn/Mn family n=1 Tax=Candidatus Phytoplasma palmae TaxID=85624 RepID=UPI0039904E1A